MHQVAVNAQRGDGFSLADNILGSFEKEAANQKVTFRAYDDRITATALVGSLADPMFDHQKKLDSIGHTTVPLPAETTAVIIGAGIAGLVIGAELTS
eukprot:3364950-Prymnesium_polylepis.1